MHRLPSFAGPLALSLVLLSPALAGAQDSTLDAPPAAPAEEPSTPPPPADAPFVIAVPPPAMVAPVSCTGGRAASEATLGRCCWPGQGFSVERARCEGVPVCPAGSMAHGDDCVITAAAPVTAPASTHSFQVLRAVSPQTTTLETSSSIQHGLVGAGVTFLLAGYVASATYGPSLSNCDGTGLVWLAPIAGALIGAAMQRCGSGYYGSPGGSDTADWIVAVGTAAFQLVGVVMIAVGAKARPITIERGPDGTRRVELDLGASPTLRF